MSGQLPPARAAEIDEILARYPVSKRSATLPLLHLLQEHFGHVPDDLIPAVAAKLGIEPVHVLELVTFYPMFRRRPAGRTHLRVCRTLSCALAGAGETLAALCAAAGIERPVSGAGGGRDGHGGAGGGGDAVLVSGDGRFSIEFVECLASCGSGPAVMVDDELHEGVTPDRARELVERARAGQLAAPPPPVPAVHPKEKRLVFANIDRAGWTADLACYLAAGGYRELRQALAMAPADIVREVKVSGLRGRGGAGFPCGVKWGFIKPGETKPVYLICNADESEPGTFKDRHIIHQDPHQLLEGLIIAAYAVGAHLAYIYIRGEFPLGARVLERAIAEARAGGYLGDNILGSGFALEVFVHRGAGAYICGEETGLIESLEGKRPYPRIKPPYFPAVLGLYQCPTIVNNVETLCHVKHIVRLGGAGYAKLGRPDNTGTRVLCVSGDVVRPGYYEIEVGAVTLGELIHDLCGGLKPGRRLKAVIPGGSSAKVLRADERLRIAGPGPDGTAAEREIGIEEIVLDFDSVAAAGSMAGSGGVIVLDDSRDMVWALNNINAFYAHESCGQCTPCREGALWMRKITDRLLAGGGVERDPATLAAVADNIAGRTVCAFGEACSWPTQSFVAKFPEEFAARGKKPLPPPLPPEYVAERLIADERVETVMGARGAGPMAAAAMR